MEEKNTKYMELSCQDFMEQLAGPGAVRQLSAAHWAWA